MSIDLPPEFERLALRQCENAAELAVRVLADFCREQEWQDMQREPQPVEPIFISEK